MVYRLGFIKRGFTVQKHIKVIPRTVSEQLGSLRTGRKNTSERMRKINQIKAKAKASEGSLIGPAVSAGEIPQWNPSPS